MKQKNAFTLIELLVVIFIIGILATLAIISLNSARVNARDAKRMSDMKQLNLALELYLNENGTYPESLSPGDPLVSPLSGFVLMNKVPTGPATIDGDCTDSNYVYTSNDDNSSYTVSFCTGKQVSDFSAGDKCLTPGGILNSECNPSVVTAQCNDNFDVTNFTSCGDTLNYCGEQYDTVLINGLCWFSKNLNIGDTINSSVNFSDNDIIEKYCYDNNSSNCDTYGGLYSWSEAMKHEPMVSSQGICPNGWRIPTKDDWDNVIQFTSLDSACDTSQGGSDCSALYNSCCNSGVELRANSALWTGTPYGTDSYSFASLPAGIYYYDRYDSMNYMFFFEANMAVFASSTLDPVDSIPYLSFLRAPDYAYAIRPGGILQNDYTANDAFSVRCVRNN